jgi:hypothetical protein
LKVSSVYSYTAFGLKILSAVPIDALEPAPERQDPDITIRLTDLSEIRASLNAASQRHRLSADELWIQSPDLGTLLMRNGREILLDPPPELDLERIQVVIVGLPFATLLQQRGFLLLHGSCIEIDGGAIAFVGDSGMGKSTLAAALHARGHKLMVDDLIAIRFDDGHPVVQPGFPQFKLWRESVVALGGDPDELPQIDREIPKLAHRITEGFSDPTPLPLRRIYLLSWGEGPRLEPLTPRQAFFKLSVHSYGNRWLGGVAGPAFLQSRAELTRRLPVKALVRPRDLSFLNDVVDMVELDCRDDG